eukprot:scaffold24022_cov168-Amphora_coffeaeformis.AAC.6
MPSMGKNKKASTASPPSSTHSVAEQRVARAEKILKEECGIDLQDFVTNATLDKLMKQNYPPSKLSRSTSGTAFCSRAINTDILFGRGVPISKHPGNILFRQLVAVNQKYFLKNIKTKEERRKAIDVLVAHLERTLGTRFLEEIPVSEHPNTHYRLIPYQRVYDKFKSRFGETRGPYSFAAFRTTGIEPDRTYSSQRTLSKRNLQDSGSPSPSSSDDDEIKPTPVVSSSSPSLSLRRRVSPRVTMEASHSESTGKRVASANAKVRTERNDNEDNHDVDGDKPDIEGEEGHAMGVELEQVKELLGKTGVDVETFISECKIEPLRNGFTSKLQDREYEGKVRTYSNYRACDVILGRGSSLMRHPGNILFRHVMGRNNCVYKMMERREKLLAAEALLSYFESKNIRFLAELPGGKYEAVSYLRIVQKFMTLLQKRPPLGVRLGARTSFSSIRPPETQSANLRGSSKEATKDVISESGTEEDTPADDESDSSDADNEPIGNELEEVQGLLQRDGIVVESFLSGGKIENLLKHYKPSKLKTRTMKGQPRVFRNFYSSDVLFGRGIGLMKHPGNILFRHVMGRNSKTYKALEPSQKRVAADALMGYFESEGVRFLEPASEGYRAVEYNRVLDKYVTLLKKNVPLGVKAVVEKDDDSDEENGSDEGSDSDVEMVEIDRNQSEEKVSRTVDALLKKRGTSLDAFLKKATMKDKDFRFEASTLSSRKHRERKRSPTTRLQQIDVCLARGNAYRMHPGNWLYRQVIGLNKDFYQSLHRESKEIAADALLALFESANVRFLSVSQNMRYYVLEYDRLIEKIKQSLREKYTLKSSPAPLVVTPKSKKRPAMLDCKKTHLFQKRRGTNVDAEKPVTATPSGESADGAKKRKVTPVDDDSRDNYTEFITVGHFVPRFPDEDDDDKEDDEAAGPVLGEIRRAFRASGNAASSTKRTDGKAVNEGQVEELAQIYRHSSLRICKPCARAPLPIFFQ